MHKTHLEPMRKTPHYHLGASIVIDNRFYQIRSGKWEARVFVCVNGAFRRVVLEMAAGQGLNT
ncbi:hypothetical protein I79_016895 [Cricetulus griseus]|uniref:Uncharacterized protein n=1 Tax=Cricetulus griseus TaxID=10029 RepID=G3I0K7_CRIGR|nr:hypothetical protein I79_016895 [Cricetulus griseus]